MKGQFNLFYIISVLVVLILGLANSGLHPVSSNAGYTGAPGDSNCSQCHMGSSTAFEGKMTITGLPDTIITNHSYRITITITNPDSLAKKAGFQLLALTGTNLNAGTMSNNSDSTNIRTVFGGKTYFGHAPARSFPDSAKLSYSLDWTAPASPGINPVIKFYSAGVLANDNNDTSGDKVIATSLQIPIRPAEVPLSVIILDVTAATCADSLNGAAKAVASGGSGAYNYIWSNGTSTSENRTMLPGFHAVTVSDHAGNTTTANVSIPSPPPLLLSFDSTPVCDSMGIGSIQAIGAGGVGNFVYQWSTGTTSNILSDVKVGQYIVTITDQNNCKKVDSIFSAVLPPIKISGYITNPTCFSQNNGSVVLSIMGGAKGYDYRWSNGDSLVKIQNLGPGNYSVTVTDSIGCAAQQLYSLEQPVPIVANLGVLKDPTCHNGNDGSIELQVSGGTPQYHFLWSDGTDQNGENGRLDHLKAGLYTVTITDLLDCAVVKEIELVQPSPISIMGVVKQVSCYERSDGSILLNIAGTNNPILYQWSNAGTTKDINQLNAGKYFVTVTDSVKHCFAVDSFEIFEPELLQLKTDTVVHNRCHGDKNGKISIYIMGGSKEYKYQWSNHDTTSEIHHLSAGNYKYTVTDHNLCALHGEIPLSEPPPIIIEVDSTNYSQCKEVADGFLGIKVLNHQGSYKVTWSDGTTSISKPGLYSGIYSVTVTDSLLCTQTDSITLETHPPFRLPAIETIDVPCFGDRTGQLSVQNDTLINYVWSTGDSTHIISKLTAGQYWLMGIDKNGCHSTIDTVVISQPQPLKIDLITSDTLICPGSKNGNLSILPNGGQSPYRFLWHTGDTLSQISGLNRGTFTVTVSDQNLCKKTASFSIDIIDSLRITQKKIGNIFCTDANTGTIDLTVDGGYGALQYSWSVASLSGPKVSALEKGLYAVTITDQKGCFIQDTIRVNKIDSISVTHKIKHETTAGKSDGQVELVIKGGIAPFIVVWSNGRTGTIVDNMPPGLYYYYVEDHNHCKFSGFAVINGGKCQLSVTAKKIDPATCINSYDGRIELDIKGNFQKYKVDIFGSTGLYKYSLDSLRPDKYTFIVKDSVACSALLPNVVIKSKNPAMVVDTIIKYGPGSTSLKNGRMQAIIKGGTPPLSFLWYKDGQKIGDAAMVEGLTSGVYSMVVVDSTGCELKIDNINLPIMTSVENILQNGIKVYPNPVSDILTVENNTGLLMHDIELINSNGKCILKNRVLQNSHIQNISISNNTFIFPGIYFVKVFVGDGVIIKKIIVLE